MRVLDPVAKTAPPVSVLEHGWDVATAVDCILRSPAARRACYAIDIDWVALRKAGVATAIPHDAGKATENWQTRVAADAVPPRHSHLSAAATATTVPEIIAQLGEQVSERMVSAATLAVLYHHTTMDGSWGRGNNTTRPDQRTAQQAVTWLAERTLPVPDSVQQFTDTDRITMPAATVSDHETAINLLASNVQDEVKNGDANLGAIVTLLRGALVQADRAVSAQYEQSDRPADGVTVSPVSTLEPSDITLHGGVRPFQQQLLAADAPEMVGKAGCGEGKTAAALAWVANRVAAGEADRLVFAMPTRTTANTLAADIQATDNNNIGVSTTVRVYHSSASVTPFVDTNDRVENRTGTVADADDAKWFQAPVTVTTVDHVLRSLMNSYPFAGIARSNLLRAAVVFDEIHAYDDRLQACLGEAIQWLRQFDVPWLTLTATQTPPAEAVLPDTATTVTSVGCRQPTIAAAELTRLVPQTLTDTGSDVTRTPPDSEQLPAESVVDVVDRIDTPTTAADDAVPDEAVRPLSAYEVPTEEPRVAVAVIETAGPDGEVPVRAVREAASEPDVESVLVVQNTVTAARALAQQLQTESRFDVTYYSSEFANEHRDQKEQDITDRFGVDNYPALAAEDTVSVAVVTQVAELSLDLTADLLLTPVAPIDALIQRAGRLHRDGTATTTTDCDCRQCHTHTAEHEYQIRVCNGLDSDEPLYPYYELGDKTMFGRLSRTVDSLRAMDAVTMSTVEMALDTVYDAAAAGDANDYARAIQEDMILGQSRQSGAGDETQLDIQIRDIEARYRTDVFPALYTDLPGLTAEGTVNESELPLSPEELWWRLHNCDATGNCGVFTASAGDEQADSDPCREEWVRFGRRWTVPVPSWWLSTDSDIEVATRPVFDGESAVVELLVSEIAYGYSDGVQPGATVDDFRRPP